MRRVDLNFVFVGLMLGGSIGTVYCMRLFAPRIDLLHWLAAGWGACYTWHLWLVTNIRQGVDEGADREYRRRQAALCAQTPAALETAPDSGVCISSNTPVSWIALQKLVNEGAALETDAAEESPVPPGPPNGLRGIRPPSGLYQRPSKLCKTVKPPQK